MRSWWIAACCGLSLASSGCGLFGMGKNMVSGTTNVFTPRPFDSSDFKNIEGDDWKEVGRGAREGMPVTDTSDALSPFFSSPEARSISRNVGAID